MDLISDFKGSDGAEGDYRLLPFKASDVPERMRPKATGNTHVDEAGRDI